MRKLLTAGTVAAVLFAPLAVAPEASARPAFCETHSGAKFNPVCEEVDVSNGGCEIDCKLGIDVAGIIRHVLGHALP